MKYLTKEELRSAPEVKERLGKYRGPTVKFGFSSSVLEKYTERFGGRENLKILDCGAASGGFLKDSWNAGFKNLYALDIDNYITEDARRPLKEFKIVDLSFEKIPWPENFFDVSTAWCVLPHLENPHNFLREANRVLKSGGLFIISMPNIASPPNRKYFAENGDFPGYHENNNHIYLFPPGVFKKAILKYFDLVAIEYFINPRMFKGFKGRIRKFIFNLIFGIKSLRKKLEERWGPKATYILKKR